MGLYFGNACIDLDSQITIEDGVTVMFWYVWLAAKTTYNRLFGSADAYECKLDSSTKKASNDLFYGTGGEGTAVPDSGVWCHYAFTGKSGTGAARIYFNGEQDKYETGHTTAATSPNYFSIGNRYGVSNTQCAGGIIEDFRIYSNVLTETEIKIIYNCAGTDAFYKGLVHRFLLCEGYHLQNLPGTTGFCKNEGTTKINATLYGDNCYYYGAKIKMRKEV